jgi:V/A-type H+-transporting ATPase subunit D
MLDVKPTRSELLQLKKKIALAKAGHRLLKKKRDGLIVEFFKLLKESKKMFEEIEEVYKDAQKKLILAELTEGATKLRSVSISLPPFPDLKIKRKNLMGITTYELQLEEEEEKVKDLVGIVSVNIRIEEAIEAYRKLIQKFIKYAEINFAIYRLVEEIEKTKRKVNALEFKIIPELEEAKKFVMQRLEEMERENIFRLKRMKGKKK